MKEYKKGRGYVAFVGIFFTFLFFAAWIENTEVQEYQIDKLWYQTKYQIEKDATYTLFPLLGFVGNKMWLSSEPKEAKFFYDEFPVYAYLRQCSMLQGANGSDISYFMNLENEETIGQVDDTGNVSGNENELKESAFYEEMMHENHHAVVFTNDTDFFTCGSGFISEISAFWVTEFVKAEEKSFEYDESQIRNYEYAMEHFYLVDACTAAGPDVIKPNEFLSYDAKIDKTQPGPHILIYHTHSQEAFIDSVPGDKSTTIVGAGAKLSELLRDEYGYEVYHHTGEYDIDTRDDAYAKSAPALEDILEQYPQIQVIIDLHRDGVAEDRHLVAEWDGKMIAQFMFFNGLSYINTKGPIDYLPNPNLGGNLALSYQATIMANEYYPGLARRTYLNGYRYNMHYREKTMLIELGAQTNTVDEIMSACEPLAHILDMVFAGEEKGD